MLGDEFFPPLLAVPHHYQVMVLILVGLVTTNAAWSTVRRGLGSPGAATLEH